MEEKVMEYVLNILGDVNISKETLKFVCKNALETLKIKLKSSVNTSDIEGFLIFGAGALSVYTIYELLFIDENFTSDVTIGDIKYSNSKKNEARAALKSVYDRAMLSLTPYFKDNFFFKGVGL